MQGMGDVEQSMQSQFNQHNVQVLLSRLARLQISDYGFFRIGSPSENSIMPR